MDDVKVNAFIAANSKNFNPSALPAIREVLKNVPDDVVYQLETIEMKDPTTILLISIFLGGLGIDRFMLGDTGLGVFKLLTAGGCGIWTIVDWFMVQKRARSVNYEKFMTTVSMFSSDAKDVVYSVDSTPETDVEAEKSRKARENLLGNIDGANEFVDKAEDTANKAVDTVTKTVKDAVDSNNKNA